MRRNLSAVLACLLVMAATPIRAHHSFAMFDQTKTVTLEGTVVTYDWVNPHMHIHVMIKEGSLQGEWDVEGASTNISTREGWTRNTFKSGDKISVTIHPLRDGAKGGSLMYAISPDGRKLYHDINRQNGGGPAASPVPYP